MERQCANVSLGSEKNIQCEEMEEAQEAREGILKLNLTFNFTLSNVDTMVDKARAVAISVPSIREFLTLPCTAWGHGSGTQNREKNMRYFPLKRATEEKQYTLGRPFCRKHTS